MPTTELSLPYIEDSEGTPAVPWRDAMDKANAAIAGRLSQSVTTADVTLTTSQARNSIIDLSGALTDNRSLIVPALNKLYLVRNGCSGAFTVTVTTAAGTGVVVLQGTSALLFCDGANVTQIAQPALQKIAEAAAGSAVATITFSAIPAIYRHLRLGYYLRGDAAASAAVLYARFNGDATASYDRELLTAYAGTAAPNESFAQTQLWLGSIPAGSGVANSYAAGEVFIPHYANSTNHKSLLGASTSRELNTTTNMENLAVGGHWRSAAAINQIQLYLSSGNFVAGSLVTLYGVV